MKRELQAVSSDISELSYKSWVIDTFVPGAFSLLNYIFDRADEKGAEEVNRLKELVYQKILKVNPSLNPESLYVDFSNTVTLRPNKNKLTECPTWKTAEDDSGLMVLNFQQYFDVSEHARTHAHSLEVEHWNLLNMQIKIRVFNRSLKSSLLFGFDPKTEDDVKYYVAALCIDSFHQIYTYISQKPEYHDIPVNVLITSLFDLSIKYNKFLDVSIKDIKKINKNTKHFREGAGTEAGEEEFSGRTNLAKVPKKEILALENIVLDNVFGQTEAVRGVCNALKRAYLGLKLQNKPIGSFLFYGPTSTGKTELAKVLANTLVKSPKGLLTIPCGSTVQSDHSIHTLIGSPPGYVGYEERGVLSHALETGKFKILLFDEVDKGTPKLFDLVLEMLDEGRIMTADGEILDITECVIIFTSNIGQEDAKRADKIAGFDSETLQAEKAQMKAEEYRKAVEKTLKPEFLARLSGMYFFPELDTASLIKTAQLHLNRYMKAWAKKFCLELDPAVPAVVVDRCKERYRKAFHARDIKDFIDVEIVQKLGDFIIERDIDFKKIAKIVLTVDNENEFIFEFVKTATKPVNKTNSETQPKVATKVRKKVLS